MTEKPEHAKFWDRVGAYLLDVIIVGAVSFALNYANILHFKSFLFYFPVLIIGTLYKPYMESHYEATLGKMIMKLKVTDLNYQQISFEQSIVRSLILLIPALIYAPLHYFAFENEAILETDGFMEFSKALSTEYPLTNMLISALSLLALADLIFLIVESSGERRWSLKDMIAKTYVIKISQTD